MNNWDTIDYQKIKKATVKSGLLTVLFYNGDEIGIPLSNVLPIGITDVDEDTLTVSDYEFSFDHSDGKIRIPWDKIRILTDKEFAQAMAGKAEEHSKLIGARLKALRERKEIKSMDLAERAGLTPQTISRIETGKTDVGFGTLRKILAAMGYTLKDLAQEELAASSAEQDRSWSYLLKRFTRAGIDNALINKIVPDEIKNRLKDPRAILPDLIQSEISTYFHQIFGWNDDEIWSSNALTISDHPAQLAFFKTPSKGNLSQIRAYSHYAYYLSNAVSKVSNKAPKYEYPGDIDEFKLSFYTAYKQLTLSNLLNFTWDLGIGVIPLNDQGVFHGASWNINENHVIVLKQRNESHARWIFDLLHELYHVFVHLEKSNSSVVETEELNPYGNNDSPEELEANTFAGQFIFGNSAEAIALRVMEKAEYRIEYLKDAVIETATHENISAEFIANYLAFRLQRTGQNWWGTANSFQNTEPAPFVLASKILKQRISLDNLNPIDRNLLNSALNK